MSGFQDIFLQHVLKREKSIKTICKPLQDCLGIPLFCYGRVETNGTAVNLANCPEELEFYYESKLYLQDPYLVHPHLLRSGTIFIPSSYNPAYMQKICKEAKIGHLLLLVERSEELTELFFFGLKEHDKSYSKLFNILDLLRSFTRYFRREAEPIIEHARREKFNIKTAIKKFS